MLAISISINLFALAALIIAFFLLGFFLRSAQLRSLKLKVIELETEMLRNHADILDLQREKAILEQKITESKIPVIPLKSSKEDDNLPQAEAGRNKR